jgi:hypothetical protein
MDKLRENVLRLTTQVRQKIDDDRWLHFAKLCQLQRYELNKLLGGEIEVNPVTFMRIAVALELVGIKTRLSELDSDTRKIVMDLGSTVRGEIPDYFPKPWHRVYFTNYVCRGEEYTAETKEKIHCRANELVEKGSPTNKPKVNTDQVPHLRLTLETSQSKQLRCPAPSSNPNRSTGLATPEERFKVMTSELLELAQGFVAPGTTEADRDRLRQFVGQDNIFTLKNLLSRLSSSRAFNNRP